jgi:PAS domain S-box-containing protein
VVPKDRVVTKKGGTVMNIIACLDLISILAGTAAMLWIITARKYSIPRDTRLLTMVLLFVTLVYEGFMMIEWLGITNKLESFEDMVGAMVPMMWAFVFYSFIQQGVNQDIRTNEENLRITLNSIGDGVIATDTHGRITRMNPVAENLTGWHLDESKGKKFEEVFTTISSETREKLKDPVGEVLETGKTVILSHQPVLVARNKREYNISYSVSPIYNIDNEVTGVVLVFSDETEKYQHSEILRASEERLNLAIEGTKAGLWDWYIKTGKLICNEQWANMIGYELSELEPISFKTWERLMHPEDYIKADEILLQYFQGKIDSYECETRMKHKQGHWVWVLDRGMLVEKDANGNPIRMIGAHIDISKQKRSELDLKAQMDENQTLNEEYQAQNEALLNSIERIQGINEELKIAKQKAEESDRLKSAFLANMSHEIRTPMNGVIGFSEMMADPNLDSASRMEYAGIIIDSSRQLLSIVNDILDISRIEAGLVSLTQEEVHINELITVLHAFFEPQGRNKNLKLQIVKSLSNDESVIITDRMRLRQVLTNLLNNALKFTQAGFIEFGYDLIDGYMRFFVRDSGIGIPVELHEKIFEPFRQVELEMSFHYGGTGLGLSISRKLVELLRGKIWLESQPGTGSVFYFTIPYNHASIAFNTEYRPETKPELLAQGKVVLIAEDDDINYLYLEAALSKGRIKLLRARNGLEAVEMCKNNVEIQLVLMDIKMPFMNGYDATRQIKTLRPDLPVIIQTAYAMSEEKNMAFDAGCDDYIAKPIRKLELIEMVFKHISRQGVK